MFRQTIVIKEELVKLALKCKVFLFSASTVAKIMQEYKQIAYHIPHYLEFIHVLPSLV